MDCTGIGSVLALMKLFVARISEVRTNSLSRDSPVLFVAIDGPRVAFGAVAAHRNLVFVMRTATNRRGGAQQHKGA